MVRTKSAEFVAGSKQWGAPLPSTAQIRRADRRRSSSEILTTSGFSVKTGISINIANLRAAASASPAAATATINCEVTTAKF